MTGLGEQIWGGKASNRVGLGSGSSKWKWMFTFSHGREKNEVLQILLQSVEGMSTERNLHLQM